MKFGIIPIEDPHHYQESLQQVELAEKLGFHSVWLEEHHGAGGHYHPSPLLFLAGYATRTEHIILGTDIVILPLYHPVRLAEDVAELDIMSKGRVILGVALGYRSTEFAAFQIPMEKRGAQFVEMIRLIKRLWSEDEVTYESERYRLDHFSLEPKPIQKPHPPIWIGGWGELAIKRAAQLADAWVPGPTADLTKLKEAQSRYHAQLAERGVDPLSRPRPLTRDIVIAATAEAAEDYAQRYLLVAYRDEYIGWGHPLIGSSDSKSADLLNELRRERFIIGDPPSVINQISFFNEKFGMDHLIFRMHFPGMPPKIVTESIELIGREVIPAFKE